MTLNTSRCNNLTPLHFKVLKYSLANCRVQNCLFIVERFSAGRQGDAVFFTWHLEQWKAVAHHIYHAFWVNLTLSRRRLGSAFMGEDWHRATSY